MVKGWKGQGCHILPGMWKPQVNAHGYKKSIQKQQGICTGKVREKKVPASRTQPCTATSNSFLAQHAKADVCCLDLTRSLGDLLVCVISVCNDVCLSVLQVSDSLAEHMIQKATEKPQRQTGREQAALGTGDGQLRTQRQLIHRQVAACCIQHLKQTEHQAQAELHCLMLCELQAALWDYSLKVKDFKKHMCMGVKPCRYS